MTFTRLRKLKIGSIWQLIDSRDSRWMGTFLMQPFETVKVKSIMIAETNGYVTIEYFKGFVVTITQQEFFDTFCEYDYDVIAKRKLMTEE